MLISTKKNLNLEEVKLYLPVSVATDIEAVIPFIEGAEAEFIEPMLGAELYANLLSYYANPKVTGEWIGTNHAKWAELLKKVQRSLINLAFWQGFDMLAVSIDSTGFHREESETRKGLYKYQEQNLKNGFRNNGFNGLDKVMAYLETEIEVFEDYLTSSYYTFRKASIIPDTATFNAIYFIDNSRMLFLRLHRYIDQVEDFTIQSVLGSTLYDKVKAEMIKTESPDADLLALVPYLRKPLVYLAMASALSELGVNITDRAIFLESLEPTTADGTAQRPLSDQNLINLIRACERNGDQYLSLLKSFLLANPTKYTDYSGFAGSVFTRDNTEKKTFFVG